MAGADVVGPEHPLPPPRRMPRRQRAIGAAVAAVLAGLVIAVPVYLFAPAIGDVSGRALQESLAGELNTGTGFGARPCRPHPQVWDCEVWDPVDSGLIGYRVRREGRCWHATIASPAPRRPAVADGCVRLRHQLRLGERLLGL